VSKGNGEIRDDGCLSAGEVADLHDCAVVTVYRAIGRGEFPGLTRDGRRARIPRAEAEAWSPKECGRRRPAVYVHKLQTKVSGPQLERFEARKDDGETDAEALRRLACEGD